MLLTTVIYIRLPAKRQSNADKFYFAANNGSIEQKGSNAGEVAETITRDFHPKGNSWNSEEGSEPPYIFEN